MAITSRSSLRRKLQNRRRCRIESLESRSLLAVGAIPLDISVPINRTVEGFTIVGTANIAANVTVLDPASPSQISITRSISSGTGSLSGSFLGADITGTFYVDSNPSTYRFSYLKPDTLRIEIQVTGTLELLVDGVEQIDGIFTTTLTGEFNAATRQFDGKLELVASADGFDRAIEVPIQVVNAIAPFSVPDASMASLADQVFFDQNNNGLQDQGESGVGGVRIALVASESNQILDTIMTDDAGFYSFINLAAGVYEIKVQSLPDGFDLGRQGQGNNESIDSDVSSHSGRSSSIDLASAAHLRNVDIALRKVAFEWQNPETIFDVTGEGKVSSLDALRVINELGRRGGTFVLPVDRAIGQDFLDVTGDGSVTALDALRVINVLATINLASLSSLDETDEFVWIPFKDTRSDHDMV